MLQDQEVRFGKRSPDRQAVCHAATLQLQTLLPRLRGETLICFSEFLDVAMKQDYFRHCWHFAPVMRVADGPRVIGDYDHLPFLSESVDNFILPHILDFTTERHRILREIWRALVPEGQAIILGFNSLSLFGLPDFLKREPRAKFIVSIEQIRKLLLTHGFFIEQHKTFYFRPKFLYGKEGGISQISEVLGQFLWPAMGCMYLFLVKKPVLGMTPLLARQWKKQLLPPKGAVEPSVNYSVAIHSVAGNGRIWRILNENLASKCSHTDVCCAFSARFSSNLHSNPAVLWNFGVGG